MSRLVAPLLAFSASVWMLLVFTPVLLPHSEMLQQYDFWVLLLLLQVIIASPLLLLELALAKRSQSSALKGIMQLTREADVSPRWRGLAWAGAVLLAILASILLLKVSDLVLKQMQQQGITALQPLWVYATLAVLSLACSRVPRMILLVLSGVFALVGFITIAASAMGNAMGNAVPSMSTWQMSHITQAEWGAAVALVILNSVIGTGIFWQLRHDGLAAAPQTQTKCSNRGFIAPVLLLQALAIVLVALGVTLLLQSASTVAMLSLSLAGITLAAMLWQMLLQQLQQRQVSLLLRAVMVLLPMIVLSQLPFVLAIHIVAVMALLLSAGYAIFAGWKMKISHLRKALNVQNEALYNLWRIAIRIVLPLVLLSAIISLAMGWR